MNGAPLPPQHGFPLRLVVPGWYGMQNVKWLTRITVLEEPYSGFQNSVAYRMYDADGEPGEPVTRMLPRSLMVPPGVPDFMTRTRHLEPRTHDAHRQSLVGPREHRTSRGLHRRRRNLRCLRFWTRHCGPNAWRGWSFDWNATPGEYVLSSRATDAAGNTQPLDPPWNLKGYANNAVERITVQVAP